ncbi:hypothetical protein PG997_012877 [Apiospora hydei]|uniref:Uncharacterized protein n=1 Tax=Apiospora hydei TaxID=1337664 RepID=A0ABR1V4K6_9PEZI
MAYTQQLSGFNPVSTSTASNTSEVGLASNNIQLPTENHTSGVLQIATTNQQGNATQTINWWQPPSDFSDSQEFQDVDMQDWDSCDVPELDGDAMSISSFNDQDWDPTEITPPDSPMDLDPNATSNGNNNTELMNIDTPSHQLSFWDQMDEDYKMDMDYMVVDADGTLDTNRMAPIISPPYPRGHPVLRALDVDTEVDEEGDILMKPTLSKLHY